MNLFELECAFLRAAARAQITRDGMTITEASRLAAEKITAEIAYQTEWAAWHKERGNVESAAIHRGTAAGLKRALAILTAAEAGASAFEEPLIIEAAPARAGESIPTH